MENIFTQCDGLCVASAFVGLDSYYISGAGSLAAFDVRVTDGFLPTGYDKAVIILNEY
jgi:hypothetical protein